MVGVYRLREMADEGVEHLVVTVGWPKVESRLPQLPAAGTLLHLHFLLLTSHLICNHTAAVDLYYSCYTHNMTIIHYFELVI